MQPRYKFINLYIKKSKHIDTISAKLLYKIKKKNYKKHFVLTGYNLDELGFLVRRQNQIFINIPNNKIQLEKLAEYIRIIRDIYRTISKKKIDRKDFFTNPSIETQKILDIFRTCKKQFIDYLMSFIDPCGGTPIFNYDIPIDDIIYQVLDTAIPKTDHLPKLVKKKKHLY